MLNPILLCALLLALAAWGIRLTVRHRQLARMSDSPVKFCPNCGRVVEWRTIGDRRRIACKRCSFVHWNNPKPVTITLIPSGKGIVMVRRKNEPAADSWALPGGYVEAHESPEQGAIREVFEEVGLKVQIDRLIGAFVPPSGANEIILIYLAKPVSENPVAGDDAKEAGIFTQDKLPEPIVFKLHQFVIDSHFAGLPK